MGLENKIARRILVTVANEHKGMGARDELAKEIKHARDVSRWLLIINPAASVELQASALLHDCERLTDRGEKPVGFQGSRNTDKYLEHKRQHALRSANLAGTKLAQSGVDGESIERICWLITHHDDTGREVASANDRDLDELVAADSFSFFTSIARDMLDREGPERVKDKALFMVGKIPPRLRPALSSVDLMDTDIQKIKTEVLEELTT